MPTPRPIIAASCVLKSGIVNTWLPRVTSAMPVNSPNRAVPIGRPMASTEPKAMSRMTTAARMPSSSDAGSSNVAEHVAAVLDVQALHVHLVAEVTDLAWRATGTRTGCGRTRRAARSAMVPSWLICRPSVCRVERAGDLDALQLVDLLEQAVHRLLHLGRVHAGRVLEHDLRRRAAAVRVGLLQHLEDRAGLGGGQLEVGPEVGADDAVGEDVQPDQDRDPHTEDDPAAAEAGAGESLQHGGTSFVSDLQRGDV